MTSQRPCNAIYASVNKIIISLDSGLSPHNTNALVKPMTTYSGHFETIVIEIQKKRHQMQ